jgi:hypothetical protein
MLDIVKQVAYIYGVSWCGMCNALKEGKPTCEFNLPCRNIPKERNNNELYQLVKPTLGKRCKVLISAIQYKILPTASDGFYFPTL